MPRRVRGPLLIDSHVHIHESFELGAFFSAARANFRRSAVSLGLAQSTPGCLMLAETPGENAFTRARNWLAAGGEGAWSTQSTDERISLVGHANDGWKVLIIAGRQVVTREGLEVLGLGVDRDLPFDLPLDDTICAVYDAGALPVVPWGFGKWLFGRGKRVMELLDNPPVPDLFLGDNAGRPRSAHTPRQFSRAAERGIPVLPGTDPLPLNWHETMPGRYGLTVQGAGDVHAPGGEILTLLREIGPAVVPYGSRVSFPVVLKSQFAMRFSRTT